MDHPERNSYGLPAKKRRKKKKVSVFFPIWYSGKTRRRQRSTSSLAFFGIQDRKISERKTRSRLPRRPTRLVGRPLFIMKIFSQPSPSNPSPPSADPTPTTAHISIDGYTSRRTFSAPTSVDLLWRDVFFSPLRSSFRARQPFSITACAISCETILR